MASIDQATSDFLQNADQNEETVFIISLVHDDTAQKQFMQTVPKEGMSRTDYRRALIANQQQEIQKQHGSFISEWAAKGVAFHGDGQSLLSVMSITTTPAIFQEILQDPRVSSGSINHTITLID